MPWCDAMCDEFVRSETPHTTVAKPFLRLLAAANRSFAVLVYLDKSRCYYIGLLDKSCTSFVSISSLLDTKCN